MLCSPEDPAALVAKLRAPSAKASGLLKGFYKVTGRKVISISGETYIICDHDSQT